MKQAKHIKMLCFFSLNNEHTNSLSIVNYLAYGDPQKGWPPPIEGFEAA